MAFIQKYLFRELLTPVIATTAALAGVAILSSSLGLLTVVVSQRQAAFTLFKLVLLSAPNLVALVLPISAFVATLYAINKLHTEQEIVVCFAAGLSRWQVVSPAMRLSAFAVLIMLVINMWVAPACGRIAREELFKVRTDLMGSIVKEGEFTESPGGLTVYAQSVDAQNVMHNLFIHQVKADKSSATYDAKTGIMVKRPSGPVLLMRNGSNEQFTAAGTLNFLRFGEYTLDLTPYVDTQDQLAYKPSDMYLHELVFADKHANLNKPLRRKMWAEASARLSTPLYIPAFVLFALLAVIGGSFSRLGYVRRIIVAMVAALLVRLLGVTIEAICENTPVLNFLQYLVPLVPGWIAGRRLFLGPRAISDTAPLGKALRPLGASA
ncbi:LptF/LptG family permease [Caulobacter sp. S45]|jgi:lipopolysaccharide export system permease protein|uniref:LptF/LptG family permease n=1 Tax=Caulobacter sp. S45 TaxID=1641861 RepID=UPI00131B064C|nr:LptF/LptG family permease [Caulobacter sp. S45]